MGSLLWCPDSLVEACGPGPHRLSSSVWGLSFPRACGIFVPRSGIKPTSPALKGGFLTTGQQGSAYLAHFKTPSCIKSLEKIYHTQVNFKWTTSILVNLLVKKLSSSGVWGELSDSISLVSITCSHLGSWFGRELTAGGHASWNSAVLTLGRECLSPFGCKDIPEAGCMDPSKKESWGVSPQFPEGRPGTSPL